MSVEVHHLHFAYPGKTAVDDVSFHVGDGECFGLVGPDGAGKTTLIECASGLKTGYSGKISIQGFDPKKDHRKMANKVSVLFQGGRFRGKLTVGEICENFSSLYENPADYRELLDEFGLSDYTDMFAMNLKGCQRACLRFVLALTGNPEVLFIDEPTTGVYGKDRDQLRERFLRIRGKKRLTAVIATDDGKEAARLCDRIAEMEYGRIVS